jgi:hypothetical protein
VERLLDEARLAAQGQASSKTYEDVLARRRTDDQIVILPPAARYFKKLKRRNR